jgi:hypothetical protein
MPRKISVDVIPEILIWLRESSGWNVEEVSKKLRTTSELPQSTRYKHI